VLADAEALCSRVAILAGGRLVATGQLTDILAFQIRGWELVVSSLAPAALERARAQWQIVRAIPLGRDRYALELSASAAPDRALADLVANGAVPVSLNPLRDTLEDYFVRQVGGASGDRGLERA